MKVDENSNSLDEDENAKTGSRPVLAVILLPAKSVVVVGGDEASSSEFVGWVKLSEEADGMACLVLVIRELTFSGVDVGGAVGSAR